MNFENIIPKQETPKPVAENQAIDLDSIINEVNKEHASKAGSNEEKPQINEPADMSDITTRRLDARGDN